MPRYDFKCTKCGRVFEAMVPSETNEAPCPACDCHAIRMPSAPGFVMKGYRAENGYSTNPESTKRQAGS